MGDIEEGASNAEKVESEQAFMATDPEKGLTGSEVANAREKYGPNEVPVPEMPLYMIFLRQFMGFLPLLIELAAVISLAVEDFIDFGIIVGILAINACLGFREEYHAKKSLDELTNSLDSEISVRRDGETCHVLTKDLVPGDIIILLGGTCVPADVKWIQGDKMQIDTAPLTGEPLPRKYPSDEYGDVILSGSTVVAGECYAQVLLTGTNTEIGRAQADIMKDKSVRVISVFQRKIMTVVQILVTASLGIVVTVLLIEGTVYGGFDENVKETILDALSIMIASIPVALPLVLQVNLALGASFLAKKYHAIVTSIPALQDIASMSMLCSDKTGTLTTANMSVITDRIYAADGFQEEHVILYAYLCSNPDKKNDPIDRAVVQAFQESSYKDTGSEYKRIEIIGFNPSVKRVVSFVKHGDKTLTIAKGLPAKILDTAAGAIDDHELQWKCQGVNDKEFMKQITETDRGLSKSGYKTIGIAVAECNAREEKNPVWKFVGLLPMLDPPREDTRATIESLHHANISVKMITGDHVNVGKETARLIGLGTDIRAGEEVRNASHVDKKTIIWEADGFAAVLPSDKREVVTILRNDYGLVTGMTGDGVNDAPALSAAQVGIAVEGATDAAKNAADLILTEPGLSPIYGAILESRRIFARIKSYVVYRVAASIILVLTLSTILFASGCAVDPLLVIILALLNDISMIPVAYDHAQATTKPQLPNSRKLVLMSLYYGFLHTAGGLIFIFLLDHDQALKDPIELNSTCSEETRGFIWFHLVLVTELMIFSVRAPTFMLFSSPSLALLASVLLTCVGAGLIAGLATSLSARNAGWIILYNVGCLLIVDVGKIWFRRTIHDDPGEVIIGDELLPVPPIERTEAEKTLSKRLRYVVHNESLLEPTDRQPVVEIRRLRQVSGLSSFFNELRPVSITDGYVQRGRQPSLLLWNNAPPLAGTPENRSGRYRTASTPW